MRALIAGTGRLPAVLADRLAANERPFMVCELQGYPADPAVAPGIARTAFRIEHLGSLLAALTSAGVAEVCFAGAIRRPPIDPAAIDVATLPLVPRMMAAIGAGDDAALRMVIAIFEEAGFAVIGADEICPELLPPASEPDALDDRLRADARRGMDVLEFLGAADVGQACAVSRGQVLALEAAPGTDAMLRALAAQRQGLPEGGVLCKAPKPGQDRRIDLPTIGPRTVALAAEAGLTAIAIEAGGVLMLDPDKTRNAAEAQGLSLWIRPRGAG